MIKRIGFIGLGKMGKNLVRNLLEKNYEVVVYNRSPKPIKQIEKAGAIASYTLKELASKLPEQKMIMLMITTGKPVDQVIKQLLQFLSKGDIIIDGGNSFYKDSIRRYALLKRYQIHFIDMGTSGGLQGARYGASLTIGGDKKVYKKVKLLFKDIATKNGYAYVGSSGSGHLVKMIHNGIEYALLESYAEGLEVLNKSQYKLNLKDIAKAWNNGSIIRSYLLELIENILKENPNLKGIRGVIGGGETGTQAYKTARSLNINFKTLKHALEKRKLSQKNQSFGTRLISSIRNKFGGHEIN